MLDLIANHPLATTMIIGTATLVTCAFIIYSEKS